MNEYLKTLAARLQSVRPLVSLHVRLSAGP